LSVVTRALYRFGTGSDGSAGTSSQTVVFRLENTVLDDVFICFLAWGGIFWSAGLNKPVIKN
jgi:hypothetical protein